MILYLNENLLTEAVGPNKVMDALNKREAILINYTDENSSHPGLRYIEPYVYGITKAGNPCIRAYQYWGDTKRGVPKWKMFRLDRIQSWKPTGETFEIEPKARGWATEAYNNNGDGSMGAVYQTVELGEEPLTDYQKLKARTKQLQNNKPLNINQVLQQQQNKKPQVQAKQDKTPSGPMADMNVNTTEKQPQTAPIKPQKDTISKPIGNTNNHPQETENPNILSEPKHDGPITNNEPQINKNNNDSGQNNVMSPDDFKKMIQRNLEITSKEKAARGRTNLGNKL